MWFVWMVLKPMKEQNITRNWPRAGYLRRLAAGIYDLFLALAIFVITGFVGHLIFIAWMKLGWIQGVQDFSQLNQHPEQLHWLHVWVRGWCFFWIIYFYIWFWQRGQTLGMRAWRLRLQYTDGAFLSRKDALLRFFWSFGGLGNLLIWCRSDRRALQDYLTASEIVYQQ